MEKKLIYMDNAATTPVKPEVLGVQADESLRAPSVQQCKKVDAGGAV